MYRQVRVLRSAALLTALVAAGACGKKLGPSELPTLVNETFTGVLQPQGSSSHTFTVQYAVNSTNASITITSLTPVAGGANPPLTVGVAFGNVNDAGVCTRTQGYSSPFTNVNVQVPTSDYPFLPGRYCVQIYDNPDQPTVSQALNYTLIVAHY